VKEIQAILRRVQSAPGPWVLATLVSVEGSSYRRAGARALIAANGDRLGSISGGCLEEDVLVRAARVRTCGKAELARYDTTSENDLVWGVGLGCHGIVRVLIEPLSAQAPWLAAAAAALGGGAPCEVQVLWESSGNEKLGTGLASEHEIPAPNSRRLIQKFHAPTKLFVFGAGDDAQPLVRMAAELGWRVTVADPRAAYATPERFPEAHRWVVGRIEQLIAETQPPAGATAVIMTHHYIHDLPLLHALLPRPLAYLGLLGPKKRAERMLDVVGAEGLAVTPEMRARLFAPVGLDLGAEGPDEVALSIIAEIQATLAARDARPLRERQGPIHDEQH